MNASALLYGRQGCGKTTIAEDLAHVLGLDTIVDDFINVRMAKDGAPALGVLLITCDDVIAARWPGRRIHMDEALHLLGADSIEHYRNATAPAFIKSVLLVGPQGSGKSTIAPKLAALLGLQEVFELDHERLRGTSVPPFDALLITNNEDAAATYPGRRIHIDEALHLLGVESVRELVSEAH